MIGETTTAFFCVPATDCAEERPSDLSETSTCARDPSTRLLGPVVPWPLTVADDPDGWACPACPVSPLVSDGLAGRLEVGEAVFEPLEVWGLFFQEGT